MRALLASLIGAGAFLLCGTVQAYLPYVVPTPGQNVVIPLNNPQVVQTLHSALEGYPHMYEFYTKEPLELFVEVTVPDVPLSRTNVSGIILAVQKNGSVKEVARLKAKEAAWETYRDWILGESYRKGGSYKGTIERGSYRIEVSTPDNIGLYALRVGTKSDTPSYFALVGHVVEVKQLLGKSIFSLVASPLIYVPLLVLLGLGAGVTVWRLRRSSGGRLGSDTMQ